MSKIKTLGELKASGYKSKTIKDELRDNLVQKMKDKEKSFEGIHGFEDTVIPELERAILSKHNINLLGLRGQAKTKIARQLTQLLDEQIPFIKESEIHDDPLNPISRSGKEMISKHGDETPISWLNREDRFYEKLATPDVTIADLIGDIDPIKAANLKLSYADDRVIHYGMIPRANRCIFVINELPDLQARIQVALFNILQEGDIQIRGFKLRMPLDIQFVFTANPEDYTNRGSIVTPLKDRIGSQILTHYPNNINIAKSITDQEARMSDHQKKIIQIPEIAKDLLEQISFEARESEYIDAKSGVSARLSISARENLISTAERRLLMSNKSSTTIRLSDFMGIIPAITGKVELVYEGETEGAAKVAEKLISAAVKRTFLEYFPNIKKLQKENEINEYSALVSWFSSQKDFQLMDDLSDQKYQEKLDSIDPLNELIEKFIPQIAEEESHFWKEIILWSLAELKQLSKNRVNDGYSFNDILGGYLNHF
jgi:magnesium chelatase subunit I